MPQVKALRGFSGTADEGFVQPGHTIDVADHRHRALAVNGLVEPPADMVETAIQSNEPGTIKTGVRPDRRTKIVSKG